MPGIYDNQERELGTAINEILVNARRADFCVGYLNLRGWSLVQAGVERLKGGEGACCRVLIGMLASEVEEARNALALRPERDGIDNATAQRLREEMAALLRTQIASGLPTAADEDTLRRFAKQLRSRRVFVKLFCRYRLHAKLYLLERPQIPSLAAFVGSSNLTMSGLKLQGELNLDVFDADACAKLAKWFRDRWEDKYALDISDEVADLIEASWASPTPPSPYLVYLKMAYHLSEDAREGVLDGRLPPDVERRLLAFQRDAVYVAARHVRRRGGVLLGDVVGLGKTFTACALARLFQEEGYTALVICPKNLVAMWERHLKGFDVSGQVLSITRVQKELAKVAGRRIMIIDESHNLRNPEGQRYAAIADYLQARSEVPVVLLSATPYNKSFQDLGAQLGLFLAEDQELSVRPERLLREIGEEAFRAAHQCSPRTLAAFRHSEFADDWRELMQQFLVRRTRSFIRRQHGQVDPANGRVFISLPGGQRHYFPDRVPKTVEFTLEEGDPYSRMFAEKVVDALDGLRLPRYGLNNFVEPQVGATATAEERVTLGNLNRAGTRLKGFCRTNLFKRLESAGASFLLSLQHHVLRNHVVLHALRSGLPVPIGRQDLALGRVSQLEDGAAMLDADLSGTLDADDDDDAADDDVEAGFAELLEDQAAKVYEAYRTRYASRFRWLPAAYFNDELAEDLSADADSLLEVLESCGEWDPAQDRKLDALHRLVAETHPDKKVLVFTQFADTARYLAEQLSARGVESVEVVLGSTEDPTGYACRFSPESNEVEGEVDPIRVLIATDVLSEGQNLQDSAIVVSYDLPWAIIRLIQRAGRVDRIGQKASEILCYSFMPAKGIEDLIALRTRLGQRLKLNAEVVGSDERFFDEDGARRVLDLFNEKAGILDDDEGEVDLASFAHQIWTEALENSSDAAALERQVKGLPDQVLSTHRSSNKGVLLFLKTEAGNHALAWIDPNGVARTTSPLAILEAARCEPGAEALPRQQDHFELVEKGVELILQGGQWIGGQLGRKNGPRYRTYERLSALLDSQGPLFREEGLAEAVEQVYRRPLRREAADLLGRMLRERVSDLDFAAEVRRLHAEDRLCISAQALTELEAHIVCSLGLDSGSEGSA